MIRRTRRPILFGIPDQLPRGSFSDTRALHRLAGGNSGNLAFTTAIRRHLVGWGDRVNVRWNEGPGKLAEVGEVCIVPAANQLGNHMNMGWLAELVQQVDIPVVVIGLGAQAGIDYPHPEIPEGTLSWVKAMAERAPSEYGNLGVRGDFTQRVLQDYGFDGVHVLGCPSLFLNPSARLGRTIERNVVDPPARVAVAAGHPLWRHLAGLERSLTRMVTATGGAYICQAPLAMAAIASGEMDSLTQEELRQCLEYVDPEMSVQQFNAWALRYAVISYEIPRWIDFLKGFDFVIGTRIHGVMLGLQAGVPALCIASDSRTRELCETMAVPHVFARDCLGGLERGRLVAMFSELFDAAAFDANRRRLAGELRAYLRANSLRASRELARLARRSPFL